MSNVQLVTIDYTNKMADKIMQIENIDTLSQREKRVSMCKILLKEIKNMDAKKLEPYLEEISIDTRDSSLLIKFKVLSEQFRDQ